MDHNYSIFTYNFLLVTTLRINKKKKRCVDETYSVS